MPTTGTPTTRTATFLFCDLVASTELFARLGHERADDVRRLEGQRSHG